MDAVTYPNEEVTNYLNRNFVACKIDVSSEDSAKIVSKYAQIWTPTFIYLTPDGRQLRRSTGYYPPNNMMAELHIAMGYFTLDSQQYAEAYGHFEQAAAIDSQLQPEAMYFKGVSAYKRDHDPAGLLSNWRELANKYPESIWWTKASFIPRE